MAWQYAILVSNLHFLESVSISQWNQPTRTSDILEMKLHLDGDYIRRDSEVRVEWVLTYGSSESQLKWIQMVLNNSLVGFIVSKYSVGHVVVSVTRVNWVIFGMICLSHKGLHLELMTLWQWVSTVLWQHQPDLRTPRLIGCWQTLGANDSKSGSSVTVVVWWPAPVFVVSWTTPLPSPLLLPAWPPPHFHGHVPQAFSIL